MFDISLFRPIFVLDITYFPTKFFIMFVSLHHFIACLILISGDRPERQVPPYMNPELDIEERVYDLLGKMTLEEKADQLRSGYNRFSFPDFADSVKIEEFILNMPGMLQPEDVGLEYDISVRNAIQKTVTEKSRLGIPMLFADEALHGAAKGSATSFPQAIALGCSWNPEMVEEIFKATAEELRTRGTHLVLSPVVDLARDPRWGRFEECYGEDPYHVSIMGTAAVRGLQNSHDGHLGSNGVAATLKHFTAHGSTEGGRNKAPANISCHILRDLHLEPFRQIIKNAHPRCVMPSYNEVDGIPMHHNRYFLKDILRDEFRFDGMIVSDFQGISELCDLHNITSDYKQSALASFNAGVEYDLPDGKCFDNLPELVRQGKIKESDIDTAVSKILRLKFELGLFENPYSDLGKARQTSRKPSHKQLALEAALESIVLLKNDSGILPLDTADIQNIAVIGPGADDTRLGEYSGIPYYKSTIYEAVSDLFGKTGKVYYAEGTRLTETHSYDSRETWFTPATEDMFPSAEENMKRIRDAVKIARKADIIILVIGENELLCRESFTPDFPGDNASLSLMSQQYELFDALHKLNKPTIVCLMHGRPLDIKAIAEKADAVLDIWYAGQETGRAVAELISGKANPSGKLSVTYPKTASQIPINYNLKRTTASRDYVDSGFGPLYPFGFGLSYTVFEYSNPQITSDSMYEDDCVEFSCDITNTGNYGGKEVIQLYIRDENASMTRPAKELKGFRKIYLAPGETNRVSFTIDESVLEFYNIDNKYVAEPGKFTLMIGSSSQDIRLEKGLTVMQRIYNRFSAAATSSISE